MLRTDFVHGSIVAHVDKIDVHLNNVLQAASSLLQDILDVFEDLLLLGSLALVKSQCVQVFTHGSVGHRPFNHLAGLWVHSDIARAVNSTVVDDRLGEQWGLDALVRVNWLFRSHCFEKFQSNRAT